MFQVVCVIIVVFYPSHLKCQTIVAQTEHLLNVLFTDYNKIIPPRVDGDGALEVLMEMFPRYIKEFDEVSETFVYIAGLYMLWKDYRLAWDPANYSGIEDITVPVTQVWTPEIFLASPATKEMYILQPWNQVRIEKDGQVSIVQGILVQSSCSLNVKYYPFDTQSCDTLFMSLVYRFYEVTVKHRNNGIHFGLYTENSLWDIVSTNVYSELIPVGVEMQIHFIFNLKRKSQYVTVNVLLPMLCMGLLNTLVFLLVPESGERIGYCITTLLAIAVYMTIIMDTLPQSSTPVPLISYKLAVDLLSSAFIILCVILNLRIHGQSNDKPVPACIQAIYRCLTCRKWRRNSATVSPASIDNNLPDPGTIIDLDVLTKEEESKIPVKRERTDSVVSVMKDKPPTWQDISFLVDVSSFVFFALVSFFSFTIFVDVAQQDQ